MFPDCFAVYLCCFFVVIISQVARLDKDYYCVRVTLPNFGEKTLKPKGYRFESIVLALAQLITETQQQRNRPNEVRRYVCVLNCV